MRSYFLTLVLISVISVSSYSQSLTIDERETFATHTGIVCGSPSAEIIKINGNEKILSTLETPDECYAINSTASGLAQGYEWQRAYDTLKYSVEHCTGVIKTYGAFSALSGTNQYRNSDLNRFPEHLQWLKKILYYDSDSLYYCEDVRSMLTTFQYFDSNHHDYFEGANAIIRYMIDSSICGYLRKPLTKDWEYDSTQLYKKWKDTVTDSLKTPFEIVLPSLEDLDLTILRGKPNAVTGEPTAKPTERILSFTAGQNPFGDEVSLSAELSASTMLHLSIFDELGRELYSEGLGFKQAGEYKYLIPTKGWSSGVYYARLSTSGGEVRTVKLLKQ